MAPSSNNINNNNSEDGSAKVNKWWIVDSGAAIHVSPNKMFFDEYEPYVGDLCLTGFNGSTAGAIGRGSVRLKMFDGGVVELKDVWHVPQATSNLISAGILHASGFKLESATDGTLNMSFDDRLVMKAVRLDHNNVYYSMGEAVYDQSHIVTINDDDNNNTNNNISNSNSNNYSNNSPLCSPRVSALAFAFLILLVIALVISLIFVHSN